MLLTFCCLIANIMSRFLDKEEKKNGIYLSYYHKFIDLVIVLPLLQIYIKDGWRKI